MGKKSKDKQGSKKLAKKSSYNQLVEGGGDDEEPSRRKDQRRRRKGRGGKGSALHSQSDDAFRRTLQAEGSRTIVDMAADGNCLFRSLSDQLYLDHGNRHDVVRNDLCDFVERNKEEFENFLLLDEHHEDVTDFDDYVDGMRQDGEWGGNVELVAAARLYRRNITVFSALAAFTIESGQANNKASSSGPDLLLSYHENDHYNSVRDGSQQKATKVELFHTNHSSSEMNGEDGGGDECLATKTSAQDYSSAAEDEAQRQETLAVSEGPPPKQQKKNDPCACGSGKKYKKCCLMAERSRKRMARWREQHGLSTTTESTVTSEDENDEHIDGAFRVLKI